MKLVNYIRKIRSNPDPNEFYLFLESAFGLVVIVLTILTFYILRP